MIIVKNLTKKYGTKDKTEEVINKLEDYVRKHLSDNLVPQFKEIFYKFLYYDIELKITKNELEKIPKECI